MKNLFAGFLKYHVVPVLIAVALAFLFLYSYQFIKPVDFSENHVVRGKQTVLGGHFGNCAAGEQSELELAACLSNPEVITIFGSSELGTMAYSPFYFMPDSLNMPTVAFGHAYQQHFSVFCELLAMKKHLKNSKICIIVSPSWFETEGTNIEAFLEFVRPNFLKSIVHNQEIPLRYKMEIGRFVSEHFRDIEQPSEYLYYFRNLYENRNIPMLKEIMKTSTQGIQNVRYVPENIHFQSQPRKNTDWDQTAKQLQKKFLDSNQNNRIYVSNAYYSEFLLKDGVYGKGKTEKIAKPSKNREYQDFLLLVELLKQNNCDATFIIQPLNPYHYEGLENYSEVISSVKKVIEQHDFHYLNLFVTDPKAYEPATLNDIMHLGDYGWLKINRFLFENYKKQ